MKVVHVEAGKNLYGGALQVRYLLEGLQTRGVENLLVVAEESALADALSDSRIKCYRLPMRGDLDIALIPRLKKILSSESPDIVHLHSRRGADLLGGLAARWAGVKTVVSRRVDNPEPRWWVGLKYRLFDRVITISEGIRRVLLSEGLPPGCVVCVHSAVDTRLYAGQQCDRNWLNGQFQLDRDSLVVAVVAQLIPRKGHRFLLQALPVLLDSFPGLRLLVLGKGSSETDIRSQISDLGLSGKVIMGGFRDDLERIFPCLDLLIHPALMEGLGVSLLQAAAAGVPIVAVDAGGVPEAVRDGVNGLLVPGGDSRALAAAVTRLLSDPDLARQMGAAGKHLVEDEFSIDAMVEGNLAVYRSLVT
ncbi:MAG: glycosyltransferase [Chromatiaceae bacterium]|nr:glycosyltransferase [Chromatiaceae bacterium]MCP5446653.1 glycosyltransferase [Chromatiaceae bacterium]